MTLEEAIAHCEEKAKELKETAKTYPNYEPYDKDHNNCLECANDHEQLAEWLRELKEAREKLAEWNELELLYACYGIVVYKVKENDE